MKKYEKYKDSGIEWIGEIPSHWDIKRFKYSFKFINEKCELDLPKIGLEHIESSTGKRIENDTDFEGDGTCFQIDDILFGKLRPYLAKVFLSDFIGKAVGDFFVFRPEESIYPKFGHKFLLSRNFIEITNSSTFGSKMPRVSPDFINELKTIVPPFGEQTTIANYLDRKTSEIDELISDKKRLLELYEEEKTAIINELVTGKKVWDGNAWTEPAKVKDSGIEWLGEIPEHWEVKRLKYVAFFQRGHDLSSSNFIDGDIPVYGSNGIIGYHNKNTGLGPSIVIGRSGSVGEVNFIKEPQFWAHNTSMFLLKDHGNNINFLFYLLKSLDLKSYAAGTAVGSLNRNNIHEIKVAFPPLNDQQSIVHHVETEYKRINIQIERTKKLIDLLTEYCTALISEVVTGKTKVGE